MSNTDTVVTSSTSSKKKKKKASSNTPSAHMKNKEGIQPDDYEPLSKLIKSLLNESITTKEAFEAEVTKFKLKKSFLERVGHSLAKHGIGKLFNSGSNIVSMKYGIFTNKANIIDKLKEIQTASILPVYVASHTVAAENLLKAKPTTQTSVILVVSHDRGFVSVGKGRVIGYVNDDKVKISVSGVESNCDVVYHNEEFNIGLIEDWDWNLLTLDFADLNRVSPVSLVNMTSLLDPQNNHVDNSDIFGQPPTIPHNMSQSLGTTVQPNSGSMLATTLPSLSGTCHSGSNIGGSSSGLASGSNSGGTASLCNSNFSGMGGNTTNYGSIASNSELEQQKRFFEEKLIQQQNVFQKALDESREQCNQLKRKVEDLTASESKAKKKCIQLKKRYIFQQVKVRERAANLWPAEDNVDDDDDGEDIASVVELKGVERPLSTEQVASVGSRSQFVKAASCLMVAANVTSISESDFNGLEREVIKMGGAKPTKSSRKRLSNMKYRYPHLFHSGASGSASSSSSDNGASGSSGSASSDNGSASGSSNVSGTQE